MGYPFWKVKESVSPWKKQDCCKSRPWEKRETLLYWQSEVKGGPYESAESIKVPTFHDGIPGGPAAVCSMCCYMHQCLCPGGSHQPGKRSAEPGPDPCPVHRGGD